MMSTTELSCVFPEFKKKWKLLKFSNFHQTFGRDEATRTPDPYVPNVVRYQLRYIPIARKRLQRYGNFLKYVQVFGKKIARVAFL